MPTAMIWFSHFGEQFLGKMDPKTGKVWEFPLPVIKAGFPVGSLDLKTDKAGNLWLGMMYQGGVARFDKKTETFKVWSIPKEWQTDAAQSGHLDPDRAPTSTARYGSRTPTARRSCGSIRRPDSGRISVRSAIRRTAGASASTASRPTATTISICSISRHRTSARSTPRPASSRSIAARSPTSRPRRGEVDEQNRLWFAEYAGNAIGMFDPKTENDQRMGAADAMGPALRRRRPTRTARPGPAR